MAPYKIIKQGYMQKEPPPSKRGLRKKLHRYWFVLVEDKRQVALVYFKNEDSYIARQRNEGFIRLDDFEAISVVGEYLGSKHAFVVKTPRSNYHLVPESRYDLHEWIFTLHNSLEAFKKKQRKARDKHGHRQRSNTVDSTYPRRPSTGASGTTPPTPTRRAPPPPTSSGSAAAAASKSPRRKPVRPAPIAPGGHNRHSQEVPNTPTSPNIVLETPPPGYSEREPINLSQEGYSVNTMDSDTHPVMDLDISQTEHDAQEVVEIQPVHTRAGSDPLVLHHQSSSASLPDLVQHEGSSSPDDNINGEQSSSLEDSGPSQQDALNQPLNLSPRVRHTRHLSLISSDGELKPQSRRKKSKRSSGSLKQRSRSPPNLPPPPPPGNTEETSDTTTSEHQEQDLKALLPGEQSNTSLGGSEVMNTISNIDEQLDMINNGFNPKPSVPVPQRSTESPIANGQLVNHVGNNEGTIDHDLGPSPQMVEDEEVSSPTEAHHKSTKGRHRVVMFKEEVEDIPSYEPQVDNTSKRGEDEEIPSSVAALKKKLFGIQESEVTKYKKEGVLSPRYTHPENMSFGDDYEFHKESSPFYRENSPNVNNNNSEKSPPRSVEDRNSSELADDDNEENVYDRPWDQMSKYKVIGIRKRTWKKERTPPLPPNGRPLSGEVMMSEVPQPGSTELRHVQSLERARKNVHSYSLDRRTKHEPSPPRRLSASEGDSLLASISTTLQARSRYGSDSFLSTTEPVQPAKKKAQSEMRISSRGELEKIKAAHRRETGSAEPSLPSHTSPPHTSHNHTSPTQKPITLEKPPAAVKGHPKMAASVEELKKTRQTHVTYDANTQSHILRSLV